MRVLVYFLIVLAATVIGSVTGMGGGVIIKPLLDLLGDFNAAGISVFSTVTVLVMAVVSLLRQRKNPERPDNRTAIPLALGAAAGGILGALLLGRLIRNLDSTRVTVVQNVILGLLIIFVFVYMNRKKRFSTHLTGAVPAALAGLFMGLAASFLSIGGGPINVALIVMLFGFSTKSAALYSLFTILFSQLAKLVMLAVTGKLIIPDTGVLAAMLVAAVAGGLIGSVIHKRVSEKGANTLFSAAQILVFGLVVINVIRNL